MSGAAGLAPPEIPGYLSSPPVKGIAFTIRGSYKISDYTEIWKCVAKPLSLRPSPLDRS